MLLKHCCLQRYTQNVQNRRTKESIQNFTKTLLGWKQHLGPKYNYNTRIKYITIESIYCLFHSKPHFTMGIHFHLLGSLLGALAVVVWSLKRSEFALAVY